jgi:hypothetical protein
MALSRLAVLTAIASYSITTNHHGRRLALDCAGCALDDVELVVLENASS